MATDVLSIPPERLGEGTSIGVDIVETDVDLYNDIALEMLQEIVQNNEVGRPTVFILPVGPVGQYRRLARLCNRRDVSCANVVCINMDEYLDETGKEYLPYDHPLSFRAFMDREFYDRLDERNKVRPENRVFPDPKHPELVQQVIDRCGGVDTCFGGIGIVGHIAFNEPPAEPMSVEEFAALPTRVLPLTLHTRIINSVTAAKGNYEAIPRYAVTVGMKEILASRKIRTYMNREWQPAIARRWIHGPVTPAVPASLLQRHPDVRVVLTTQAAALPQIGLR